MLPRGRYLLTALFGGALLALPPGALAQTGTLTGRVVDAATLAPVSGASVTVADRGGLANADGRFVIPGVPAGTHAVQVERIGYADATQQVTISPDQTTNVEIRMTSEAVELGELIVTTSSYGEQRQSDLTGVIEAVPTEEFNPGRVISPEQLIQGKVAGVNIIDSGEPGGGIQVRIRGGTSVTSSNEPLFVVDGVPLAVGGGVSAGRNPLNFLNPDDIASMTVLKDASATAIYGSRGANGVVLIETKSGQRSTTQEGLLTYTGSFSSSTVVDEPEMLSPTQFRQAVQTYNPAAFDMLGSASTNWRDAVQRDGTGQEHAVAFAGATDDFDYRLSASYLDQEGVIRGSDTERGTVALGYGQGFFDERLRVSANLKGSRTEDRFTPGGVIGGATAFAPTQPIVDPSSPNGGYFEWYEFQQALNNPVAELELSIDEGVTYRSVGDLEATFEMPYLPSLSGTVRLGYDVTRAERETFRPSFLRGEAEGGNPGFVSRANSSGTSVLLDAFGNYAAVHEDLSTYVDVTAGYSYQDASAEFPYFEARGLSFDLLKTHGVPSAAEGRSTISVDESRLISFFGRSHFTVRDRYLLTLSVRRDGSSKFGEEEQWGVFPSAAVAWRVSGEDFLADVDALSDLKLRASWGVNGNQAFDNYQQYAAYAIGEPTAQYQFGDVFVPTIRPGAADPGIKWEETTSWNVGLDYGFADNRFTGALDYYSKKTEDLIFRVPLVAGTFTTNFITTNIGTLENRGFELSLDARLYEGRDEGFWWDAGFNAAKNDNEIVAINPLGGSEVILTGGIAGGVGNNVQVLQPGHPINSFFVYEHILEDGEPIYRDANGDGTINEQDLYADQNGDGEINQDDRRPFESPSPDWILGHTSLMGWGRFDAGFTLRAHLGNHVYNNVASNFGHYRALAYVGAPNNLHASVLDTGFESEQYFSDYYVEDASFLRMDNVTLGYTFDQFSSARRVRLFGTVQNVFTWTDYSGVDPLAGLNGIDNNLYPRARTFTVGANVQF